MMHDYVRLFMKHPYPSQTTSKLLGGGLPYLAFCRARPTKVQSSSGVPLVMSFHGTYETPWFHEKELGLMQTLSRYGWLGILPWGTTVLSPSSMGGVRECCSSLCDTDECCLQGRFVSEIVEACSWWPQNYDRDVKFVDSIWKWLEDHTCADRTQACRFTAPNQPVNVLGVLLEGSRRSPKRPCVIMTVMTIIYLGPNLLYIGSTLRP